MYFNRFFELSFFRLLFVLTSNLFEFIFYYFVLFNLLKSIALTILNFYFQILTHHTHSISFGEVNCLTESLLLTLTPFCCSLIYKLLTLMQSVLYSKKNADKLNNNNKNKNITHTHTYTPAAIK